MLNLHRPKPLVLHTATGSQTPSPPPETTRLTGLPGAFLVVALLVFANLHRTFGHSPQLPGATQAPAGIQSQESVTDGELKAGAYAKNIDPKNLPVWVSGGIVAAKADRVVDSLFARSLVLVNETSTSSSDPQASEAIAVCVVDSLGVPAWIVEQAKKLVAEKSPLLPHQVLISATHTHSAPALMGAHGTPAQDDYAAQMPQWIADSILEAYRRRTTAKIGYGVTNADRFIYCRRWFMEPGHAGGVLFSGRDSNIVAMNPGHDSPYKLNQTEDVDRTIPFLSVQSSDGKPIAILASFCTHYAGAPALSSDYFGVVARELASQFRPDDPEAFVGIMANGTSGDANCIDFARPAKPFNYQQVGSYICGRILNALPSIEHSNVASLDSKLEVFTAKVRLADPDELKQAQAYVDSKLNGRLPSNLEENYARETVLLSEMPATRQVPLQALKIGNLVIAGYPTETYNATGLAVRSASPFQVTLNIGLANDLLGYLPPADQFPLGGYTTWRARTSCLEESTESKVVELLSTMIQDLSSTNRKTFANRLEPRHKPEPIVHQGPNSAIPPAESLKLFEIQAHQRIELAAHEPQVIDPVAMRFDDAGNMWVVEMSDYPTNRGPEGLGRIRILKDTNHDGLFDQAKVFYQGLMFPTGLQLHFNGCLVTVGGKLLLLRDTDGDSVADASEEWLGGFAEENPQLRVNDPDFGLDGQLYLANGLRSSKIIKTRNSNPKDPTDSPSQTQTAESQPISISSSDLRWNWLDNQGVAITGPSQFGMTWDKFGNRYFCSNRNPCDGVLLEPWQSALSPLAGLAPMSSPVLPPGERSTVRPLVSAWTTSNLHSGQFTAACGVLLSHSEHLPKASLGNALTCEPTGSLVHRVGLGRVNGRSQAEEPERSAEWLASRDPWFRPVNLEEGPDGAIYIVDMHRAVIEHPDWVPDELKKRQDERWGDQCGRIYRVVSHDAPKIDPIWSQMTQRPLSTRTTNELIELVGHPRAWVRQTATRLIYERLSKCNSDERNSIGTAVLAHCNSKSREAIAPNSWIRLLYLLKASSPSDLLSAIENSLNQRNEPSLNDPSLRSALWKLASDGQIQSDTLANMALIAIQEGSNEEATQAAWYLAQSGKKPSAFSLHQEGRSDVAETSRLGLSVLDSSVARSIDLADDSYWLMAITAMHRTELDAFAVAWINQATDSLDQKKMIRSFSPAAFTQTISIVANPANDRWSNAKAAWLNESIQRIEAGPGDDETQRRLIREPQLRLQLAIAKGIAKSADRDWIAAQKPLWNAWANALNDARWSTSIRAELTEVLGISLSAEQAFISADALRTAIGKTTDPLAIRQLIAAWAQHPETSTTNPSCMNWILENFDSQTPATRTVMFQSIRSRPERLSQWLDAVEQGKISDKGLDASQIQSLKQITGELQPRIARWLEGTIQSDRHKVIEGYMTSLTLPSDSVRGKQLFAQHCSACHRIDTVGTNIGPDISDSRTQTANQLLVSILDPNRAIDNNYFRVSIQLHDGTVHDGIVTEESAEHIALKNQQSTRVVISKNQVEQVKPSNMSLMPEGIEAQLDKQAMSDLIGYIKNWRYVGGEAPVLPETPR